MFILRARREERLAVMPAVEGDPQIRLGRNLRARRMAAGITQEAFADVLGVHRCGHRCGDSRWLAGTMSTWLPSP
ncbi:MAG: hypothetical protein ACRDZR_11545 [Acidimicrobiales bacterium]